MARSLEKNPINESISSPSTVPASGHVSLNETLNEIVGGLCSSSHLISSPHLSLSSHDISFLSFVASHLVPVLAALSALFTKGKIWRSFSIFMLLRVLKSGRDFGNSTLGLELKMCHFEYWSHLEARTGLYLEKTHLNLGHVFRVV